MDSPIGIPSGKHSRCCNTMHIAFGIALKLLPNVDCPNGHPVAEQHNYINTDITHEAVGINVASSVRNNGVNMSSPIELDIIDPYVVRSSGDKIKRLLDDLGVTGAKSKVTTAVNAASTKLQLLKVTTAERLQLLKDKDCLKIKITYEIKIVIE
ncbi:hypothetical protein Tco_0356563 [Tanacetum coccineum]